MEYTEEYWDKRFGDDQIPEKIKTAIRRVYEAYPKDYMPQGLGDPMYITNVIAVEVGFGDGQGNFRV